MCNALMYMFCCIQRESFDDVDKDNDGFITLNEFNEFMIRTHGKGPTLEQWVKFHIADKRNNGKISKQEYDNMVNM